ncbi:carboxypeptidase-like regulatory domain-containing protein [Flammeovirga sp. EKP202]|uniref:TonB-dependent receptor n=1 Tax=Flammeovirga sp. EKP202 TaxID=2770592 RepID=UPI00165FC9E9|nr:carboxypeptidase-like regulatory domain-containing protein [Flammeovirga sp. EKP202]MBD0401002.1 TonB-dependent receptor [Flammeovirga sp. EKP202]
MKTLYFFILLCLWQTIGYAQQTLKGTVTDTDGEVIPFASVYLKSSMKGTSANDNGKFELVAVLNPSDSLMVSAIGYTEVAFSVSNLSNPVQLKLSKNSTTLEAVEIYGGSGKTLEEMTAMQMTGMDIVRNASANGDLYQALQTLPGTSKVGDQTGLFVRGGDATETQTIIDGTVATNPFLGNTPNMPSRGKFDPFMFEGTTFTTGGYSAEYGQALSSVLLLETEGIPERTRSSVNLHFAGVGGSHSQVWEDKTVLMGGVTYNNLTPYFSMTPQNVDWVKVPEALNVKTAFRHKTRTGMYKMFSQYNASNVGVVLFDPEQPLKGRIFDRNAHDIYINNSYKGLLGRAWEIDAGISYNKTIGDISFGDEKLKEDNQHIISKVTLSHEIADFWDFKIGGEYRNDQTRWGNYRVKDHLTSAFSESMLHLSSKIKLRLGVRGEYSSRMEKYSLAPRTSLFFDLDDFNQITLSYGDYYQKAPDEYLAYKEDLDFQKSTHYIINYKREILGRTFRVELYHKEYDQLVKFDDDSFNNNGYGYARGIDLFWRDESSISFLDYWVTYSYIDSERNYKHFPISATPDFVTNHNVNVVANFEIPSLRLQPGFTYTYASGRPYENPNEELFMSDKTKDFHNLDVAINYNMNIMGNHTVLFASFSNILGLDQVFGYEYSSDGKYRVAKLPTSKQSVFLGLFMTIE